MEKKVHTWMVRDSINNEAPVFADKVWTEQEGRSVRFSWQGELVAVFKEPISYRRITKSEQKKVRK